MVLSGVDHRKILELLRRFGLFFVIIFLVLLMQFVLEPLHGYILLGEKLLQGKFENSFNFGPDSVITVKEIAQKVVKFYGKGKICIDSTNTLHEANLLMLNNRKAKKLLGWKMKYSIDVALEKTVEWYKRFKSKENMEKFMLSQIEEYIKYE